MQARGGILVHVEEKSALPGLHVNFAKKEKPSQLSVQSIGDDLQGTLRGKSYHALNTVSPFAAHFTDKSIGFEKPYDLT